MILVGIAVLMMILGVLMQTGKGSFLISGYNTMTKEQQAQVDIKGLSKFMAFYMYFLALVFILMALFEWLNIPNGVVTCIVLLLISTVVIMFKSQKFYQHVTVEAGKGKFGKGAKWSGIISIIAVIVAGILLYFSMQPTAITISDDELTIGGMYGDTFSLAELEELTLIDEMPAISMRTNGSAIGSKLKGHFTLENGDKVTLFIDKSKPPFITFVAGGKRYYVNEASSDQTAALFEQMGQNK